MGADAALKDTWHRPHAPVITEEAKAWVVHLALKLSNRRNTVTRPNYGRESSLALCMFANMQASGRASVAGESRGKPPCSAFSRLRSCTRSESITISKKRDPEFESKIERYLAGLSGSCAAEMNRGPMETTRRVVTVSVDEKPGLQALANTAPDRDLRLPTSALYRPGATTNTSDWALVRFWRRWTCTTAMCNRPRRTAAPQPASSSVC